MPTTRLSRPAAAHTGNLIKILFDDNKEFGTVRSMRVQEDYSPEPVSGIGDIHIQEYVPTVARYTISVEYAVLNYRNLLSEGIVDEDGCIKMAEREFNIAIYSKVPSGLSNSAIGAAASVNALTDGTAMSACSVPNKEPMRVYEYCSFASGSINIQAHQIVMSDATFHARRVRGKLL